MLTGHIEHEFLTDPDPDRSHRAMKATLTMRKLDIAALERVVDGP